MDAAESRYNWALRQPHQLDLMADRLTGRPFIQHGRDWIPVCCSCPPTAIHTRCPDKATSVSWREYSGHGLQCRMHALELLKLLQQPLLDPGHAVHMQHPSNNQCNRVLIAIPCTLSISSYALGWLRYVPVRLRVLVTAHARLPLRMRNEGASMSGAYAWCRCGMARDARLALIAPGSIANWNIESTTLATTNWTYSLYAQMRICFVFMKK